MPELAEVEFFRKVWNPGLGHRIERVHLHHGKRLLRGVDTSALVAGLTGAVLERSEAKAKQMLFTFSTPAHLGIHLGMTGRMLVEAVDFQPGKHDHLVLYQAERALVFRDPRLFGRVQYDEGPEPPAYWQTIPFAITDGRFTVEVVEAFLQRRRKSPLKAVLLMQERFPGIGNWMADEILWRARLKPHAPAGSLSAPEVHTLHEKVQEVARDALEVIAGRDEDDLPHYMNERIPESWLFNHRWRDGGTCPQTGKPLEREQIGGRTTCWSPAWQTKPAD
ncbi:MAG: DNA-formamidopyrimidine glycosylase family protein [Verrucomicrobiota bacterium JB022]|nr:DNA-formamidopyrimidine glycosylase family protein [Verrucomicrobiota bacterium JB022]